MNRILRSKAFWTLGIALGLTLQMSNGANGQCPEIELLTPTGATTADQFGFDAEIDGDVVVVGDPADDDLGVNSGAAYVYRFDGEDWVFEQRIDAGADAEVSALFGGAVAVSGDVIVVGAYLDDEMGTDSGSVFVFRYNGSTWQRDGHLVGSLLTGFENFGFDVDIDGDNVVVGAYLDDTTEGVNSGSAYIFEYTGALFGWSEAHYILPAELSVSDNFGIDVAIEDDLLIAGANGDDHSGFGDAGSAFVFRFNNGTNQWELEAQLMHDVPSTSDQAGRGVDIQGDLAVVGVYLDNHNGFTDPGSVLVFRESGGVWDLEQRLELADPNHFDWFGESVSIDQSVILVGAHLDDHNGFGDNGAAYLFRYCTSSTGNEWVEDQMLSPSTSSAADHFATRVAISGDRAVIGAYNDAPSGVSTGSAGVFGTARLELHVEPTENAANQLMTFTSFCGTPGQLVALVLIESNQVPVFFPILYQSFAANYQASIAATAPAFLAGNQGVFVSISLDGCGKAVISDPVTVDF